MSGLSTVLDAAIAGAGGSDLASAPLPEFFRAATVRPERAGDPAQALLLEEVPTPPLGPGEVYVAVMASSLNFNTVWAARGRPVSTARFLAALGPPHDQPFHIVGSDAAGIVVRTGPGVSRWRAGDKVVLHTTVVDPEDPSAYEDGQMAAGQRVWGYETNYGGLADLTLVKASQLLPKPAHLTWEEAASMPLCSGTAYRMLVGDHGARMRQGDVVLVWGATGGVGAQAVQYVLNGGGTPVGVVSSPAKVALLRSVGVDAVIDRTADGYRFWRDESTPDEAEWRRFGTQVRELVGRDPDIVVEHPGRATMGASVFVVRKGGTVVTCAATSGYRIEYDNRHLWMRLKRIVGSQLANYHEAAAANRLAREGRIVPTLSAVFPLAEVSQAAAAMDANRHVGKLGVLCLAPGEGLGVDDAERREQVGEERLNRFRGGGS